MGCACSCSQRVLPFSFPPSSHSLNTQFPRAGTSVDTGRKMYYRQSVPGTQNMSPDTLLSFSLIRSCICPRRPQFAGKQSGGSQLCSLIGHYPSPQILRSRPHCDVCGWTEVSLSSETVIAQNSCWLPFGSMILIARTLSRSHGVSILHAHGC